MLFWCGFIGVHGEIRKGHNEAWSRGSGIGAVMGALLLGVICAAIFSIGRQFRTYRAWLLIILVVAGMSSLFSVLGFVEN